MTNPYFQDDSCVLYKGDCTQIMNEISDESIDVIFADPPYFLSSGRTMDIAGRTVNFEKGEWDRCRSLPEIDKFNSLWISIARKKLKENGTIWVSGTFHNMFSIIRILKDYNFKIINVVTWQKENPKEIIDGQHLTFSAEFIVWARKSQFGKHVYNFELMKNLNGGKPLTDVWKITSPELWERRCGSHPTQKPLLLLYRILLLCTRKEDIILDPFAGSCTTGIAAKLLGRHFIGVEQNQAYLEYGVLRLKEIYSQEITKTILNKLSVQHEVPMVIVNHARPKLRQMMVDTGICYVRAGVTKGSLLVKPGFERLNYVLLHTDGNDAKMFKLRTKGNFQIWTRQTLEEYGFSPTHASYYIVFLFDNQKEIAIKDVNLIEGLNTFRPRLRAFSDFIL